MKLQKCDLHDRNLRGASCSCVPTSNQRIDIGAEREAFEAFVRSLPAAPGADKPYNLTHVGKGGNYSADSRVMQMWWAWYARARAALPTPVETQPAASKAVTAADVRGAVGYLAAHATGMAQWEWEKVSHVLLAAAAQLDVPAVETSAPSCHATIDGAWREFLQNTSSDRSTWEAFNYAWLTRGDLDPTFAQLETQCQAIWRSNVTLVCRLPKGHSGNHGCGRHTWTGEVDVKASSPEEPSEPRMPLEHYRTENGKLRKAMADLMHKCPRCRAEAKEALSAMTRKAHHPRCELMQPHGHEPPKCTCPSENGPGEQEKT